MFDVFKKMNEYDTENGTSTLGVCNELVSANNVKNGGHVTIGVPESVIIDLMFDGKIVVLLVIDKESYDKTLNDL